MPISSQRTASVDRIARVNEILKREIAGIIEKRGMNESSYLISVTKVHCSSCLKNAAVYISILGATKEQEQGVIKELLRARPDIQRSMSKHVILKYTPVLHFITDKNLEDGDRVLSVIREMEENENE